MYVDKKLSEHNLLQAIARVNRVSRNKHRGYIVDYIGLAQHLGEALSIYSEADAADIQQGLKDSVSELPILEERYQRLLQHFRGLGVADIDAFIADTLPGPEAEIAVVHATVGALKDIKARADFDLCFNKFLQSLNLILPNPVGHRYRGAARRFGYLLQMAKQRYKDTSLDIAGAGAKVKALINEHLVSLGIDPKIPPVELLSEDFMAKVGQHSQGDAESKASEMEHAIRRHCTVHRDEDPAFYKRMSEKLERLIKEYGNNWALLAKEYEKLRQEVVAGRTQTIEGLGREATTFYDHVCGLAFDDGKPSEVDKAELKALMRRVVELLQDTIDVLDFWKKPTEVKRLRGAIGNELLLSGIVALNKKHERIAVEIVRLAEKRYEELVK
jgi:type I restriction enzyme R subunit